MRETRTYVRVRTIMADQVLGQLEKVALLHALEEDARARQRAQLIRGLEAAAEEDLTAVRMALNSLGETFRDGARH